MLIEGSAIIFVNSSRQVLLFLRDDKPEIPFPNTWDILGGRLDPGETPEQCIIREMREEIEFELRDPEPFQTRQDEHGIVHLYWQRADFDLGKTPLHEGQRLKWFSEDEIRSMAPEQFAFGSREHLLDFYNWLTRKT